MSAIFLACSLNSIRILKTLDVDSVISIEEVMAISLAYSDIPKTSQNTAPDLTWAEELIVQFSSNKYTQLPCLDHSADRRHVTPMQSGRHISHLQENTAPNIPKIALPQQPELSTNQLRYGDRKTQPSRSRRQDLLGASLRPPTTIYPEVFVNVEITTDEDVAIPSNRNPKVSPSLFFMSETPSRTSTLNPRNRLRLCYSQTQRSMPPCPIPHVQRHTTDEECSICSTSLSNVSLETLVWCKGACGHNFHRSCFKTWRDYAARPLRCVYCRAIWRRSCEHDLLEAGPSV